MKNIDNYEIINGEFCKEGKELILIKGDVLYKGWHIYHDGNNIILIEFHEEDGGPIDDEYEYYKKEKRKEEWGDGPENNGSYHPAYDGYDYDTYVNGYSYDDIEARKEEDEEIKEMSYVIKNIFNIINSKYVKVYEDIRYCTFYKIDIGYNEIIFYDKYYKLGDYFFYSDKDINNKIKGVDIDSFQILDHGYAKDNNSVYYKGFRLEGSDPKTFNQLINSNTFYDYSKDKYNIYFENIIIDGVDLLTFKILTGEYSRDKNNVYFKGGLLKNYNQTTYQMLYSIDASIEDILS